MMPCDLAAHLADLDKLMVMFRKIDRIATEQCHRASRLAKACIVKDAALSCVVNAMPYPPAASCSSEMVRLVTDALYGSGLVSSADKGV